MLSYVQRAGNCVGRILTVVVHRQRHGRTEQEKVPTACVGVNYPLYQIDGPRRSYEDAGLINVLVRDIHVVTWGKLVD